MLTFRQFLKEGDVLDFKRKIKPVRPDPEHEHSRLVDALLQKVHDHHAETVIPASNELGDISPQEALTLPSHHEKHMAARRYLRAVDVHNKFREAIFRKHGL